MTTAVTHIVVADDERNLRRLVSATLAAGPWAVHEASNGSAAWDLVRAHRPAVALLDVQMPGRTGLELARAIKDDPDLAGTTVVLLTARSQDADVAAGAAAGADRYLTKPFSPLELLDVVSRAVRQG